MVDTVKTTLGPRGMDKLMVDSRGKLLKRRDFWLCIDDFTKDDDDDDTHSSLGLSLTEQGKSPSPTTVPPS